MGKARRNREKRRAATAVHSVTPQDLRAVFGDNWESLLDSDDSISFDYPPEELMDTTGARSRTPVRAAAPDRTCT